VPFFSFPGSKGIGIFLSLAFVAGLAYCCYTKKKSKKAVMPEYPPTIEDMKNEAMQQELASRDESSLEGALNTSAAEDAAPAQLN
jgi:hypothetical protein